MRTVVLGTGRMGRRHIQVVKEMGLELVGVCDVFPDALVLAQIEQGVLPELHFTDVRTLLDSKQPECVIVATTAPTHSEYTCLAVEMGAKYILCEKPMAISLSECNKMIDVCASHGAHLAINHPRRYMDQFMEPKRLINSVEFGGLASVTVVAGNFGMAMNGSHYFEMFQCLTEESPAEVSAWFSDDIVPNPRGQEFEDRGGQVRVTTVSGKRLQMEIGPDQGNGLTVIYAGRYGQIIVEELMGIMTLVYREDQYRDLPTVRYATPSVRKTQMIKPASVTDPAKAVMTALLSNSNFPSGEDGRSAIATLVAAYVSNDEGHRSVSLTEVEKYKDRIFPWA
jgi:predicted dehydrogenase